MAFSNHSDLLLPNEFNLYEGKVIKKLERNKYLGIIIDQHLLWNYQIASIVEKTKYPIYILYRLNNLLLRISS